MADRWFEISSTDHFWVQRRFEVLRRLTGDLITDAKQLAEIGCGHGLLQRQVEDTYGRDVAGFDLNEYALTQNVSRRSPVCCYDVFQMDLRLQSRFDVIVLFDVLEHISDEVRFLRALLFHLAPHGRIVLNVPAGQWAYSAYDEAVGHVRRYSIGALREAVGRNGLRVRKWTYWGLPLVPVLMLRKLWVMGKKNKKTVVSAGMDTRTPTVNGILGAVSRCEMIPNKLLGTSLMAILERLEK